jgi:hypothetical protein
MKQEIIDNNYEYVQEFISKERATVLADEFKKFAIDNDLKGDFQAQHSQSTYNFIGFLELLCEKTPEVSKLLGEPVLPTYTYARIYKEGSDLKRHRDREACEISLTLNLYSDSDWPIWIQKPDGSEVKLNLSSGDAMLYRGDVADHWRDTFNGKECVQVFLHYVRSRGDNSWAMFDKERVKPHNWKKPSAPASIAPKEKRTYYKNIEDYIIELEDIVPLDLCKRILAEYPDSEFLPTRLGSGVVDRTIRSANVIGISGDAFIMRNPEVRKQLDTELFECAKKAIAGYNAKFPEAKIIEDSGYDLLRYQSGEFYTQHTDSFKTMPRAISCSFALNEDYEGGGFAFFDRDFVYKCKAGSAIMFPSNFMYPHEILPVTKGTRYSIITWFV